MEKKLILPVVTSGDPPALNPRSPPHRILVVEDEEAVRQFIAEVLIQSGYHVNAVKDGAAAWDTLQLIKYGLMITDNKMPKVTGVELLKKLHAARLSLPVIMATTTEPHEFTQQPWLRPAATLLKPYTREDISRTVKEVLREADIAVNGSQPFVHRETFDDKMADAEETANAARPGPANYLHSILVVDACRDLQPLYTHALSRPGYAVDVVENGVEGWGALHAKSYSLVITEKDMATLSGVELVMRIRAARMAVPVVLVTEKLPAHDPDEHPWRHFAATLVKPFGTHALLKTVKKVLGAVDGTRAGVVAPPAC